MSISKRAHPAHLRRVVGAIVTLLLVTGSTLAHAQGAKTVRAVDGKRTESGWLVELGFTAPLRYMSHSPRAPAESVRIELRALGLGRTDEAGLVPGDTFRPFAPDAKAPVVSIETLPSAADHGLVIEVRFARKTAFEIVQGSELHRLEIRIPDAGGAGAPRYEAAAAGLLADANRALAEGDPARAAQLCTRVLSLNAPGAHPEALELLGLARERSGQRAHAKAEYERFLERYPDHEHAPRVRQRLQALATASTLPSERTSGRARSGGTRFDVNGSLLSYYSRAQGFFDDDFGDTLYDSSWFTDLFVRARMRTDRLEVETSAAGRTRLDFGRESIGSDSRLSLLLVEVSERGRGWWGNVGRQRGDGGVIGRFDGARLGYRATDRIDVQVLGGFPLESYASDNINTDRYQVGGAIRVLDVFSLVDVELYGNYQNEANLTYRGAIGAELRHLRSGRTIVGTLDYDAYFNVVNIATLLGNQQITETVSVNGLLEYRKSPIVTMGNALIGQGASSLEELAATFSEDQLKQLAKDRSATATNFSTGARWDFHDRMNVNGSFSAMSLGGTETSGGVQGFPGTGYEFGYFVQLGVRSLVMDGDVTSFGLRIFDGGRTDRYVLEATGRFPVWRRLRLNPILRLEYQNTEDDSIHFVPRVRLDYGWRDLFFDLDFAYGWSGGVGDSARPTENTYSLVFGVRWDF